MLTRFSPALRSIRLLCLAAVSAAAVTSCAAIHPVPDADALRDSGFGEGTRVGVMAYIGRSSAYSARSGQVFIEVNEWELALEDKNPIQFTQQTPLIPFLENPKSEFSGEVAALLNEVTGVEAKPIRVKNPQGDPDDIAQDAGQRYDLDTVLFIPIVADVAYRSAHGSENTEDAKFWKGVMQFNVILYARLWDVDGNQLWEGELGRSDRQLGGYQTFSAQRKIETSKEFHDAVKSDSGFTGYLDHARRVARIIVEDIRDDL